MTTSSLAPAPTTRARRTWQGGAAARGVLGLGLFIVLIELAPRLGLVNEAYLPPFSRMAESLGTQLGSADFWSALLATIQGWAIGLGVATVGGVAVGVVIGSVDWLRSTTASTIEFLRPIPSVALIPLAVLLFGVDLRATLVLVIYASFWQVLLQVLYGVQDVDPVAHETARSYGFSRLTQVRTVIWPTALPYVMTGFRLAASVALILEITGELIIGSPGLGQEIAVAQSSGAVESMYALVIVTGLLGVAMNTAARAAEKRVLRWHPSVRRENP